MYVLGSVWSILISSIHNGACPFLGIYLGQF